MISYIKGTLAAIGESEMIVEAGAFDITVKTSRAVIERLPTKGAEFLFHTYLEMSEDAVSLYGFDRGANFRLFHILLGVSGIGPKGAFVVLSALEPEALELTALTGDTKAVAEVPGIGVRAVERIILELKNQEVVQTPSADAISGGSISGAAAAEAIDALIQLGYDIDEATRAARTVSEAKKKDSETLLREVLRQF